MFSGVATNQSILRRWYWCCGWGPERCKLFLLNLYEHKRMNKTIIWWELLNEVCFGVVDADQEALYGGRNGGTGRVWWKRRGSLFGQGNHSNVTFLRMPQGYRPLLVSLCHPSVFAPFPYRLAYLISTKKKGNFVFIHSFIHMDCSQKYHDMIFIQPHLHFTSPKSSIIPEKVGILCLLLSL